MNVGLKMNQWVVCLLARMCLRLQPVRMKCRLLRFKIIDEMFVSVRKLIYAATMLLWLFFLIKTFRWPELVFWLAVKML